MSQMSATAPLRDTTDVLIIGGGLAGTWAAISAAEQGARVILVEKGHCGTSGITAAAGPNHWWVPPENREAAVEAKLKAGLGLAEADWLHEIARITWQRLPGVGRYYDFSRDDHGQPVISALRGPEYMRAMRQLTIDAGVRIIDHAPALTLLRHGDGTIGGAEGILLRTQQEWRIEAGAVVIATGGTSFRSRLIGAGTNTGDGYLMAAEAGAALSGMEFVNAFTLVAKNSNLTRVMSYSFARFYDAARQPLLVRGWPGVHPQLIEALARGPLWCDLAATPADLQAIVPTISPNFPLPFRRRGINPYQEPFQVELIGEGTLRGLGGIDLADLDCATSVPGLYAAGDAATRERVAGAVTGGGAINSAWALGSGIRAGHAAARLAQATNRRGGTTIQATHWFRQSPDDRASLAQGLDYGFLRPENVAVRRDDVLRQGHDNLASLWRHAITDHAPGHLRSRPRAREDAAMLATGLWSIEATFARRESRGMLARAEFPAADTTFARRLPRQGLPLAEVLV